MDTEGSGNSYPPKGKEISGFELFFLLAAIFVLAAIVQIIWHIVSHLWNLLSQVESYLLSQNERSQTTTRATALPQLRYEGFFPESAKLPRSPGFTRVHPEFVITVDATPTLGGAIFRSLKNNVVYFYSADWSEFYKFPSRSQEPDKFEMLNTLIALDVYFRWIHGIRGEKRLVIQTDSNFALTIKPRMNSTNPGQQLLQTIIRKLDQSGLEYDLRHVTTSDSTDMRGADLLSRGRMVYFKAQHLSNVRYIDLSTFVCFSMKKLRAHVPSEYVKF